MFGFKKKNNVNVFEKTFEKDDLEKLVINAILTFRDVNEMFGDKITREEVRSFIAGASGVIMEIFDMNPLKMAIISADITKKVEKEMGLDSENDKMPKSDKTAVKTVKSKIRRFRWDNFQTNELITSVNQYGLLEGARMIALMTGRTIGACITKYNELKRQNRLFIKN